MKRRENKDPKIFTKKSWETFEESRERKKDRKGGCGEARGKRHQHC